MSSFKIILCTIGAAALFYLGRVSLEWGAQAPAESTSASTQLDHDATSADPKSSALWSCPMHPQIKLPDPGDCPICGMDLVPMQTGKEDNPLQLVMSDSAKELAQVAVKTVVRRNLTKPVRLVGKVDYDETAVKTISAWVPGRLDRLYVDYTGVKVHQGDHLVWLYSPDLLNAQEELLSARERLDATKNEVSAFLAKSNQRALETAREKLILLGLTAEQVAEIETRGTAEDHVMLTSPTSGVVISKEVTQGSYVKTGAEIYRIADLSRVWVLLDAYEKDVAWLRYGQEVAFEVEALPGVDFRGVIAYIDPLVNERTRTTMVRVNVDNAGGQLKPGMFVRAYASVALGDGGVVLDQALAGKWVCPMHPEIVKDGLGACDVCGMDLVSAEELGHVDPGSANAALPLIVPQSAVLMTGKRAVVYVEVPGTERPTYAGREVVLGPRAGDEYVVLAGLEEGERVVVHGAFRIDSSMQILAKPSMMSQAGEAMVLSGPGASVFRESLRPVYASYFDLQVALAADDLMAAKAALSTLAAALDEPSASGLPLAHREVWSAESDALQKTVQGLARDAHIETVRSAFEPISVAMVRIATELGHDNAEAMRVAHCPMAFDNRGASWLQREEQIANPYFGASMLRCGEIQQTVPGVLNGPVQATPPESPANAAAPSNSIESETLDSSQSLPQETLPEPPTMPVDEAADLSITEVFARYLEVQRHLASDEPVLARKSLGELFTAVVSSAETTSDKAVELQLHTMHGVLLAAKNNAGPEADLEALRTVFRDVTVPLLAIEQAVGNPTSTPLYIVHCPMAFDDAGADWIQVEPQVSNPYFGASMLRCGAVQRISKGH
jgi:membrane fusion protein, copper/silver efflux system